MARKPENEWENDNPESGNTDQEYRDLNSLQEDSLGLNDFDSFMEEDRGPATIGGQLRESLQGLPRTLASDLFNTRTAQRILPNSYQSTIDVYNQANDARKSFLDEVGKAYEEGIDEIRQTVGGVTNYFSSYLPDFIKNPLMDFANGGSQSSGWGSNEQRDEVGSTLDSIFSQTQATQAYGIQQQAAIAENSENQQAARHDDLVAILSQIKSDSAQLVGYQNSVLVGYQRKDLEINLRNLAVQTRMLALLEKYTQEDSVYQKGILKNTGLPDWVKMSGSERVMEILNQKFWNKSLDYAFGNASFINNLIANARDGAKDYMVQVLNNVRSASGQISGVLQMQESMNGEQFNLPEFLIQEFTDRVGKFTKDKIIGLSKDFLAGKEIAGYKFEHADDVETIGSKLNLLMQNAPGAIEDFINEHYGKHGENVNRLLDFVRSIHSSAKKNQVGKVIDVDYAQMDQVGIFTNRTNISITKIIPGYLARIHRELISLRTGDDNVDLLEYDWKKDQFASASTIKKRMYESIVKESEIKGNVDRLQGFLGNRSIEGLDDVLDKKDQLNYARNIASDRRKYTSIDEKYFRDVNGLAQDLSPISWDKLDTEQQNALRRKAKQFSDAVLAKLSKLSDKDKYVWLTNFASDRKNLVSPTNLSTNIQRAVTDGGMSYMRDLEFVNEDNTINKDYLYRLLTTEHTHDIQKTTDFIDHSLASKNLSQEQGPISRNEANRMESEEDRERERRFDPNTNRFSSRNSLVTSDNEPNILDIPALTLTSLLKEIRDSVRGIYIPNISTPSFVGPINTTLDTNALTTEKGETVATLLDRLVAINEKALKFSTEINGDNGNVNNKGTWHSQTLEYLKTIAENTKKISEETKQYKIDLKDLKLTGLVGSAIDYSWSAAKYIGKGGKEVTKGLWNVSNTVVDSALKNVSAGTGFLSDKFVVKDVYVGQEAVPRLFANKLKIGAYHLEKDGTIITKIHEIAGTVVELHPDGTTTVVLTAAEIPMAHTGIRGSGRTEWLKDIIKDAGGIALSTITGTADFVWNKMATSRRWLKAAKDYFIGVRDDLPGDIYLDAGGGEPIIRRQEMLDGVLIDVSTERIIRKVSDITGDVVDIHGNIRLKAEEVKNGLYNGRGMKYRTLATIVGKYMSFGIDKAFKIAKWGVKTSLKPFKWTVKLLSGLHTGANLALGRHDSVAIKYINRRNKFLEKIEELKRLAENPNTPPSEKERLLLEAQVLAGKVDKLNNKISGYENAIKEKEKKVADLRVRTTERLKEVGGELTGWAGERAKQLRDYASSKLEQNKEFVDRVRTGTVSMMERASQSFTPLAKSQLNVLIDIYNLLDSRLKGRRTGLYANYNREESGGQSVADRVFGQPPMDTEGLVFDPNTGEMVDLREGIGRASESNSILEQRRAARKKQQDRLAAKRKRDEERLKQEEAKIRNAHLGDNDQNNDGIRDNSVEAQLRAREETARNNDPAIQEAEEKIDNDKSLTPEQKEDAKSLLKTAGIAVAVGALMAKAKEMVDGDSSYRSAAGMGVGAATGLGAAGVAAGATTIYKGLGATAGALSGGRLGFGANASAGGAFKAVGKFAGVAGMGLGAYGLANDIMDANEASEKGDSYTATEKTVDAVAGGGSLALGLTALFLGLTPAGLLAAAGSVALPWLVDKFGKPIVNELMGFNDVNNIDNIRFTAMGFPTRDKEGQAILKKLESIYGKYVVTTNSKGKLGIDAEKISKKDNSEILELFGLDTTSNRDLINSLIVYLENRFMPVFLWSWEWLKKEGIKNHSSITELRISKQIEYLNHLAKMPITYFYYNQHPVLIGQPLKGTRHEFDILIKEEIILLNKKIEAVGDDGKADNAKEQEALEKLEVDETAQRALLKDNIRTKAVTDIHGRILKDANGREVKQIIVEGRKGVLDYNLLATDFKSIDAFTAVRYKFYGITDISNKELLQMCFITEVKLLRKTWTIDENTSTWKVEVDMDSLAQEIADANRLPKGNLGVVKAWLTGRVIPVLGRMMTLIKSYSRIQNKSGIQISSLQRDEGIDLRASKFAGLKKIIIRGWKDIKLVITKGSEATSASNSGRGNVSAVNAALASTDRVNTQYREADLVESTKSKIGVFDVPHFPSEIQKYKANMDQDSIIENENFILAQDLENGKHVQVEKMSKEQLENQRNVYGKGGKNGKDKIDLPDYGKSASNSANNTNVSGGSTLNQYGIGNANPANNTVGVMANQANTTPATASATNTTNSTSSTDGSQATQATSDAGMVNTGDIPQADNTYIKHPASDPKSFLNAELFQLPNGKYITDSQLLNAFMLIESRGNTNAVSPTGARGLFQFTDGTGKQYGLNTKEARLNPKLNFEAMKKLTLDNLKYLEKKGIALDPVSLYMAHNQGAGGTVEIFNAIKNGTDVKPKIRENMNHNNGKGKTPKQFVEMFREKINGYLGLTKDQYIDVTEGKKVKSSKGGSKQSDTSSAPLKSVSTPAQQSVENVQSQASKSVSDGSFAGSVSSGLGTFNPSTPTTTDQNTTDNSNGSNPNIGTTQQITNTTTTPAQQSTQSVSPPKPTSEVNGKFKHIDIAAKEIGVTETNNLDRIYKDFSEGGLKPPQPWCGAFAGWCLKQAGYPQPKEKYWSRSYILSMDSSRFKTNTTPIAGKIPYGAIGVFTRPKAGPQAGHVGFVVGQLKNDPNKIILLGGNQSDSVCCKVYKVSSMLGWSLPNDVPEIYNLPIWNSTGDNKFLLTDNGTGDSDQGYNQPVQSVNGVESINNTNMQNAANNTAANAEGIYDSNGNKICPHCGQPMGIDKTDVSNASLGVHDHNHGQSVIEGIQQANQQTQSGQPVNGVEALQSAQTGSQGTADPTYNGLKGGAVKYDIPNMPNISTKISRGEVGLCIYVAFRRAGMSFNQARAMAAEVGRENSWNLSTMFGTHTDPKNKRTNAGIISWQNARKDKLMSFLSKHGGMKKDQTCLDAQAMFLVQELFDKSAYKRLDKVKAGFVDQPNADPQSLMDVIGRYFILWAIDNPKYRDKGIKNRTSFLELIDAELNKRGITASSDANAQSTQTNTVSNDVKTETDGSAEESTNSSTPPTNPLTVKDNNGVTKDIPNTPSNQAVVNGADSGLQTDKSSFSLEDIQNKESLNRSGSTSTKPTKENFKEWMESKYGSAITGLLKLDKKKSFTDGEMKDLMQKADGLERIGKRTTDLSKQTNTPIVKSPLEAVNKAFDSLGFNKDGTMTTEAKQQAISNLVGQMNQSTEVKQQSNKKIGLQIKEFLNLEKYGSHLPTLSKEPPKPNTTPTTQNDVPNAINTSGATPVIEYASTPNNADIQKMNIQQAKENDLFSRIMENKQVAGERKSELAKADLSATIESFGNNLLPGINAFKVSNDKLNDNLVKGNNDQLKVLTEISNNIKNLSQQLVNNINKPTEVKSPDTFEQKQVREPKFFKPNIPEGPVPRTPVSMFNRSIR